MGRRSFESFSNVNPLEGSAFQSQVGLVSIELVLYESEFMQADFAKSVHQILGQKQKISISEQSCGCCDLNEGRSNEVWEADNVGADNMGVG